jgi:hypothetical protein
MWKFILYYRVLERAVADEGTEVRILAGRSALCCCSPQRRDFALGRHLKKKNEKKTEKSSARTTRGSDCVRTPAPPVHRALLLGRGGADPLEETVHMEDVAALAPYCARVSSCGEEKRGGACILSGQSSPGTLQLGQHASNATRQMPQTSPSSSSCEADGPGSVVVPVSQRHWATPCQCLMTTFMVIFKKKEKTRK